MRQTCERETTKKVCGHEARDGLYPATMKSRSAYEERQYPATTWVSTSTEGPSLNDANNHMYRKLFSYIQGNNAKGMKLNTTTPIRTRIVPCHGATCSTIFIMSFLIPADSGDSAPTPWIRRSSSRRTPGAIRGQQPMKFREIFVTQSYPSHEIRIFEGRPNESDWLEESHKLAESLRKEPSIDKSYYYTVWYDPPFQLFHRVNEVWMAKKAEKQQPSTNAGNDHISPETKDHPVTT
ncbi:uncharacterized protein CEXT_90002 [Caerostris extrusa]|uniref:Uncharacterized protein n=1 Tax=Caerostris extrusa TaxID=172846 RepID=A0AAV4WRN9_CAEEX|nr:uncharacterized protein CEXT_90002 [Caerostris extrusa]